jgi:hypothetical protein
MKGKTLSNLSQCNFFSILQFERHFSKRNLHIIVIIKEITLHDPLDFEIYNLHSHNLFHLGMG